MTAKDSADGVLGDVTAAGAIAAWNLANFLLIKCGLTHAGAELQEFKNIQDEAKPLYASTSGTVSSKRFANAHVATTQQSRLPKEDADQINKEYC